MCQTPPRRRLRSSADRSTVRELPRPQSAEPRAPPTPPLFLASRGAYATAARKVAKRFRMPERRIYATRATGCRQTSSAAARTTQQRGPLQTDSTVFVDSMNLLGFLLSSAYCFFFATEANTMHNNTISDFQWLRQLSSRSCNNTNNKCSK